MSSLDPNLVTLALFAAGYVLARWDKRGDQSTGNHVAIAELRTELSALRREVERFIDQMSEQRGFGRRAAGGWTARG